MAEQLSSAPSLIGSQSVVRGLSQPTYLCFGDMAAWTQMYAKVLNRCKDRPMLILHMSTAMVYACLLFRVISGIAEETRKHPSFNSVWEFDYDSIPVCLSEASLEDELNNGMDQLSFAVREDIGCGCHSELLLICICKAIWNLDEDVNMVQDIYASVEPTFGKNAR